LVKFFSKVGGGLEHLVQYLVAFGAAGLFVLALLDSVFVPLPGGVDAVMILLSTTRPALFPLYAAGATLGSLIGCLILYFISRRAGRSALSRFSEKKQARVRELIERYDMLAILVVTLLPPPFPFKLFIISTGVFRFSLTRFIIAIAVGRAFRFLLEGYLAAHYGAHAKEILAQYYPYIGLGLAALLIIGFVVRNLLKSRGQKLEEVQSPKSNFQ
jgi:membrane protein YqaA with SNARE-associated domain